METKDYLIVYGKNTARGFSCYKETEISCNDMVKYMPIIRKINLNINNDENWCGGIVIEKTNDGKYIEHNLLHELYPEFDHKLLDEFTNYLPNGITHIESIKIFSGEKIKII